MASSADGERKLFIEQNIVWLYTDDLPGLCRFYHEVLGLPEVLDQGACRVFRLSPTGFLGICNSPHRPRGTQGMMITLLVEDVDIAHAHFRARGVTFDGPPEMSANGTVRSCHFRDPEGYWLELQEFRDPRWPFPAGREPQRA